MKPKLEFEKILIFMQIAGLALLITFVMLLYTPAHTLMSNVLIFLSILIVIACLVVFNLFMRQTRNKLHRAQENEKALQLSEERFRMFMDTSPAIVIMKDEESRYLYCNTKAEIIQGKPVDEIIGKTEFELFPKEEAERSTASDRQVLESGKPITLEYSARDPQGVLHDWWLLKFPMYSVTGEKYVGMQILDITDRKRAEVALAHERDLLHTLMNNITDTVYFKDEKSRFTRINQQQAQFLGVASPEDALDKTDFDFMPIELAQTFYDDEQKLFATGEPIRDRLEYNPTSLGAPRWFSASKAPIKDANGQITGLVGITRNITERKLAEIEREKLIKDLEARNTELEQFTYTVSHDLKSPLVTIQGFVGYLEQDALAGNMERVKHDSLRIKEATSKMQKLLSELLELSRIGRMMNEPEEAPFEDIVQDALRVVEGQINNRKVRVNLVSDLPTIYGDKARIVEVMQNLIDNACKYMGDQIQPQIEIGHMPGQDGNSVFYVRDNGIGVEPKYHERIFGLFNKLNPKTEGSGIGLALVKRIIEIHKGRIWVESEGLGTGTTFFFTLSASPGSMDNPSLRVNP